MLLEIFDPKAPPRAIGIDLGTTNSLVAYVKNERPTAIEDCNQKSLLPSAVHYGDRGEVVVGGDALLRAAEHPRETIVSVKRFMGRGADDPETRRLGPYEFTAPKSGDANVVREGVANASTVLVNRAIKVEKTLVDGENVATLGTWSATVSADGLGHEIGTVLSMSIAQFFTVRDGKITSSVDVLANPDPA